MIALSLIVVGSIAIGGFFYFVQDRIIYLPQQYARGPERILSQELRAGRENRLLSFQTSQGQQRAAYFGKDQAKRVWLMFGGNGARAFDWLPMIHAVPADEDVGFLLVDYPGYGWCEGKPDPVAIQENVEGAILLLASEWDLDPADLKKSLSCMGHSLGAAVALESAAKMELQQVVVVSPFTTMQAMAEQVVGKPISYLLRHRFDNVKSLRRLAEQKDARVVIFHGGKDQVVPLRMGQSLGRQFAELVEFHEVPQAGHNDILSYIDRELIDLLGEDG